MNVLNLHCYESSLIRIYIYIYIGENLYFNKKEYETVLKNAYLNIYFNRG